MEEQNAPPRNLAGRFHRLVEAAWNIMLSKTVFSLAQELIFQDLEYKPHPLHELDLYILPQPIKL